MPEDRIRKTLAELEEHPDLTEESKVAIVAAGEALERGEHQSVKELMDRLQERYPNLTVAIGQLAEALSDMGF
jgi:thioredoxin-like negative regulator of GroEL